MEEDNVIYVQVDEHGRVINYTSNSNIGDQLILLQEGQDGQVVVPSQPATLAAPTPTVQTVTKPTVINLGNRVGELPTGIQLVSAAAKPGQIQSPTGIRTSTILPTTMSHLAPVQGTATQAKQTRLTLSPQRVTINPQRMSISPQKITINSQKMGKIITAPIKRTSGTPIRITTPQRFSAQALASSGMKLVQGPGSKITIRNVSPRAANAPSVERVSLDQLMSSGGVTLQKISPTKGLSTPRLITSINPASGATVTQVVASQSVTSPHAVLMGTMKEAVAYAKPDTTTDESTLMNYYVPETQMTPSTPDGSATSDAPCIVIKETPERIPTSNADNNQAEDESSMSEYKEAANPSECLDNLDETLESYLTGDVEGSASQAPDESTEADDTLGDNKELSGKDTSAASDDDEDVDGFPAGLIRGEPVQRQANDATESESMTGVSDSEVSEVGENMPGLKRYKKGNKRKFGVGQGAAGETGKHEFLKKNLNLFTPEEVHDKKSKRRSARVSNAEQQKQVEAEIEHDDKDTDVKSSAHDVSTADADQNRQNIFDILGNHDSDSASADPQQCISKLRAANCELRGRIKSLEGRVGKSPSPSKYREKSQLKVLEAKLLRFEKINEDLLLRLQEYEAREGMVKCSPPERKVDTVFRHGKFTFSPAAPSHKRESVGFDKYEFEPGSERQSKGTMAEVKQKDAKVRALHNELDQRMAMLKSRESKLQRHVTEVKDRENKANYKEANLTRRVQDIEYRERILEGKTKAAIEKRNKQGGAAAAMDTDDLRSKELIRFEMEQKEKELKRRENDVIKREQDIKKREELVKMTEKQLQQLSSELKEDYEQKLGSIGQSVTKKTPKSTAGSSSAPRLDARGRQKNETPVQVKRRASEGRSRFAGRKTSPLAALGRGRLFASRPGFNTRESLGRQKKVMSSLADDTATEEEPSSRKPTRRKPRKSAVAVDDDNTVDTGNDDTPQVHKRKTIQRRKSRKSLFDSGKSVEVDETGAAEQPLTETPSTARSSRTRASAPEAAAEVESEARGSAAATDADDEDDCMKSLEEQIEKRKGRKSVQKESILDQIIHKKTGRQTRSSLATSPHTASQTGDETDEPSESIRATDHECDNYEPRSETEGEEFVQTELRYDDIPIPASLIEAQKRAHTQTALPAPSDGKRQKMEQDGQE